MTTITDIKEINPGKVYEEASEAEWNGNKIRDELSEVLARHGVTAALVTFAVFHRGEGNSVDAIPKAMVLGTTDDIPKLLNAAIRATGSALNEIEEMKGRS